MQREISEWTPKSMNSKVERYQKLVGIRKDCRLCVDLGLKNPTLSKFDSDHIGPWSRWQGNLNADLMVVGQDWGTWEGFEDGRGCDDPKNFTNVALRKLLASIEVNIGPAESRNGSNIAFFTNAVLCLKTGNMQTKVDPRCFHNCASYLRRQIEIVNPKVVVGLGQLAFNGILRAFELKTQKTKKFQEVVEDNTDKLTGIPLPTGARAFAVYHCGRLIQNTHRNLDQQRLDWERIGLALGTRVETSSL